MILASPTAGEGYRGDQGVRGDPGHRQLTSPATRAGPARDQRARRWSLACQRVRVCDESGGLVPVVAKGFMNGMGECLVCGRVRRVEHPGACANSCDPPAFCGSTSAR